MKKCVSFYVYLVIFSILMSCTEFTPTSPAQPESNYNPGFVANPTQIGASSNQEIDKINPDNFGKLQPISDLETDIIFQIMITSGGAGCGLDTIGISPESCSMNTNGAITLKYKGAYRQSAMGDELWWGSKYAQCYDQIEFGDMIYFAATGFEKGETVTFTIEGPNKKAVYTSITRNDLNLQDGKCEQWASTPAARLEWIADPDFGIGVYTVSVLGNSGSARINLNVEKNLAPNFGAVFGETLFPLTLGSDRKIHLVYAGFKPNEVVTTYLLKNSDDSLDNATAINYLKTHVDGNGNAKMDMEWDTSLSDGVYWLLVPEIIPDLVTQPEEIQRIPGLWGIKFYTNDRFDNFFKDTQDILLRSSCKNNLTAKKGQVINLKYGMWGTNGQDILKSTKDKIIIKIFVSDYYGKEREISGYRSSNYMTMSQVPCGNKLNNAYFLYNETQIGPYHNSGEEIKIRVEYSFIDTITDGYDLTPNDGMSDIYGPNTPFSQTYTITTVP